MGQQEHLLEEYKFERQKWQRTFSDEISSNLAALNNNVLNIDNELRLYHDTDITRISDVIDKHYFDFNHDLEAIRQEYQSERRNTLKVLNEACRTTDMVKSVNDSNSEIRQTIDMVIGRLAKDTHLQL